MCGGGGDLYVGSSVGVLVNAQIRFTWIEKVRYLLVVNLRVRNSNKKFNISAFENVRENLVEMWIKDKATSSAEENYLVNGKHC